MPPFDIHNYRNLFNKILLLVGIIIIIYAILWILAKIGIIPYLLFSLIPQIVLLLVGVFIVYQAWTNRNQYY